MKKRNIRKTAAALTALALCAGVLTGCGGAASGTASSVAASSAASSEASGADADALAAQNVADLIDAIYVQQRTDDTDAQCEAAKAAWDALTDSGKEAQWNTDHKCARAADYEECQRTVDPLSDRKSVV